MKKIEFFGTTHGAYINGTLATASNVQNLGLYEDEKNHNSERRVYKPRKKSKIFIVHDLVTNQVDWCEALD